MEKYKKQVDVPVLGDCKRKAQFTFLRIHTYCAVEKRVSRKHINI
jgi:hypothetical protein